MKNSSSDGGHFKSTKQWATWSHYNSIPYRRLFHKWAYCITKTMRESSLSASQAKKVSKNLLVYFLFTNNLQVPSVLPEKELRLMFFKFVFCCVLVEFINIVASHRLWTCNKWTRWQKQSSFLRSALTAIGRSDAKDIDTFFASIDSLAAPLHELQHVTICDYESRWNPIFWWDHDQNRLVTF